MPALHTMPLQVELVCRSYVDHSALRRGVELGSSMRFDASGAHLSCAPRCSIKDLSAGAANRAIVSPKSSESTD